MKYLFFDIECSNTYRGFSPIYSIGYVLTDDLFNEEKKEDLIINPGIKRSDWCSFVKRVFLAYDLELIENKYIFSNQYRNIKSMFEAENQIVFYFAAGDDDINYLNNECDRYKKDYLQFNSVNVCKLIKGMLGRDSRSLLVEYANFFCEDKFVLEVLNIAKSGQLDMLSKEFFQEKLGIDKSIHRSDFDAYLTMMIVKKLYEKDEVLFNKVLSRVVYKVNAHKLRTVAV